MKVACFFMFALWLVGEAVARVEAAQAAGGQRVQYVFGKDEAVLVCAPLQICMIELQAGERILPAGLHLGETVRWQVTPVVGAKKQTHLIVKAVEPDITTTMIILTDRREYLIRLVATGSDFMSAIDWHYPQTPAEALVAYHKDAQTRAQKILPGTTQYVDDLNFNYRVGGRCSFKPLRVYDNGRRVFIQLPATAFKNPPIPTLQIRSNHKDSLVLYKVKADRYIVDQLFRDATLFSGAPEKKVCRVQIKKV